MLQRSRQGVSGDPLAYPLPDVHSHAEAPAEPGGPVFVDVGPERGALLLSSGPERSGLEVEIERIGADQSRTHVWVLPRQQAAGKVVHAAVFPSLVPGRYRIYEPDGSEGDVVAVSRAIVTTARWA